MRRLLLTLDHKDAELGLVRTDTYITIKFLHSLLSEVAEHASMDPALLQSVERALKEGPKTLG